MITRIIKSILRKTVVHFKHRNAASIAWSSNVSFNSEFEGWNMVYPHVSFCGTMGFGTYVGENSQLIKVRIGRFCSISQNVRLIAGRHPFHMPYVTTSPCFFSQLKQNGHTFANEQCFPEFKYVDKNEQWNAVLGNDVWIGANAKIIAGVSIGDGVVVLAGSIVTHDIPPYAIVGGIPSKVIDYRYDKETIATLMEMQWWNQTTEWFTTHWELLNDLPKLLDYYKNNKEEFRNRQSF